MIYRHDANFPYPVFYNNSNSYINNTFDLDVNVNETTDDYIFNIDIEIESEFMKQLLKDEEAQIIFVIKSRDSKFYRLKFDQKEIHINKTHVSLNEQTSIQVFIQALGDINFKDNYDLSDFYQQFKD